MRAAVADYTKAQRWRPAYGFAYWQQGIIFSRQREREKAMNDFSKATEMEPAQAEAWYNRGMTNVSREDYAGAIIDL